MVLSSQGVIWWRRWPWFYLIIWLCRWFCFIEDVYIGYKFILIIWFYRWVMKQRYREDTSTIAWTFQSTQSQKNWYTTHYWTFQSMQNLTKYQVWMRPLSTVQPIITDRNEVVAKVMFLQASVILSTGGCLPQCMLVYHTPLGADIHLREQTPPRAGNAPWADTSQEQTLPREQTPPGSRHPPKEQTPPRSRHTPKQTAPPPKAGSGIRSMSGRYASYWNAFLFSE